jgi:hypothetical protein
MEDMFLKLSKQIICKMKTTNNCLFSQQMFEKLQKINNTLREKFKVDINYNRIIINDILSCNISNLTIFDKYNC